MNDYSNGYGHTRLQHCAKNLARNGFGVHVAGDLTDARRIAVEEILPKTGAGTVSCLDCHSASRICNTWTFTTGSFPGEGSRWY